MVALVSLFAVGCGSSNDDFVFTGNNNPTPTTGSVTFQLAKAQTATVPQATQNLVFEFFNAQNARVFGPVTRAFAGTITIDGVPTTATSARITALDANDNPISTLNATFTVVAGGNVNATIGAATPVTFTINVTPDPTSVLVGGTQQLATVVTFSDGSTASVAETGGTIAFTSAAAGTASVGSVSGLVTGVAPGNTQVVATFGLNGTSVSDTVVVAVTAPTNTLVANPSAVNLTNTTTSQAVTTSFNGDTVAATGTLGNFTGDANATNLTFSSGTVSSSAFVNGGATLTYTFTPAGGTAVNTTVPVTVTRANGVTPPPGSARLELDQENLIIQPGSATGGPLTGTYFPAGSPVGIALDGSNVGTFSAVATSTVPASTEANWTFTANSIILSSGAMGQIPAANNSITYTVFFTPPGQDPVSDTVTVTATADPTLPAQIQSAEIFKNPGTLKLATGSFFPVFVQTMANDGTPNLFNPTRFIDSTGTVTGADGPGVVTVTSDSAAVNPTAGGLSYDAIGTANITITRNVTGNVGGPSDLGGGTAVVVDPQLLVTNPVGPNVSLTVPVTNTTAGGFLPYSVKLNFTDGTSTDLTSIALLTTNGNTTQATDFFGAPIGAIQVTAAGGGSISVNALNFGANIVGAVLDPTPVAITTN